MSVHSTAVVSPCAEIADDVEIGPMCIVEDHVIIGAGCRIASHAVIRRGAVLGKDNVVDVGAVLGGDPQHLDAKDELGDLVIGDGNWIREYVTVHRGYRAEQSTHIGDGNMLMTSSHVAHDAFLGNHNILANNVLLAGHVTVGNRNYFGGGAAVQQFCRIGDYTMIGGLARVTRDVPPFVLVDAATSCLVGLNSIGLRRAGISSQDRQEMKEAYRIAFREDGTFEDRMQRLKKRFPEGPGMQLWQFLVGSERGFLQDRGRKLTSTEPTANPRSDAPTTRGSRLRDAA